MLLIASLFPLPRVIAYRMDRKEGFQHLLLFAISKGLKASSVCLYLVGSSFQELSSHDGLFLLHVLTESLEVLEVDFVALLMFYQLHHEVLFLRCTYFKG